MSNFKNVKDLSLYHFHTCPFCAYTRRAIDTMGLDIELKDINQNRQFRQELVSGGGSPQVPCLRIETKDGGTQWLYESGDIVQYLNKYQSQAAKA